MTRQNDENDEDGLSRRDFLSGTAAGAAALAALPALPAAGASEDAESWDITTDVVDAQGDDKAVRAGVDRQPDLDVDARIC